MSRLAGWWHAAIIGSLSALLAAPIGIHLYITPHAIDVVFAYKAILFIFLIYIAVWQRFLVPSVFTVMNKKGDDGNGSEDGRES
ncbi:hypothetical protein [Maricaulis sp.]|uniref:hypothetical protein n=1 Tax=Maricaulis sp. TaxID=1486257 RepID=UPI00351217B1